MKLSSSLIEDSYTKGEYIIRQGSMGDTFFILNEGEVLITVVKEKGQPAVPIRTLQKGAYFGEVALLRYYAGCFRTQFSFCKKYKVGLNV